ncbi:MAG: hypothetical protein ACOC1X_01245 [Promethearchaeota archaeon]
MFTLKIENSDGEVSIYQGEEVQYKFFVVENYDQLKRTRQDFQNDNSTGGFFTVDGNWPTSQEEFNNIRKDVKVRYCDVDEEEISDTTFIRVGKVELIGDGEYKNIVVFAAKIYIMNDEGQTVDTVDLLR